MQEHRFTFFRQGGWMMMATVGSGVFMVAVHLVAARMEPEEYAVFATLLRCMLLLSIPVAGLQTVFAQQAAAAIDEEHARQLTATVRTVIAGMFFFWMAVALVVLLAKGAILNVLKISNPAALWVFLLAVLTMLWLPILRGLLQGQQHFLGLGWVAILDGVFRFFAAAVIVLVLHGQAAGGMTAVLMSQTLALALGVWVAWPILKGESSRVDWKPWLKRVVPLTFGTGVILFLMNADVLFVQGTFSKENAPFYMPPAQVGFALIQFTLPLALVMFPKIVRSAARAEKSNALRLALGSTALLGGLACLVCTIFPSLPLRILYFTRPAYWASAPLVPWFVWCMLLLTLANVLINNLLARDKFAIVPWMVALTAGYALTLAWLKPRLLLMEHFDAFRLVVQTLMGYNLLLFCLALWFTWGLLRRGGNVVPQAVGAAVER